MKKKILVFHALQNQLKSTKHKSAMLCVTVEMFYIQFYRVLFLFILILPNSGVTNVLAW